MTSLRNTLGERWENLGLDIHNERLGVRELPFFICAHCNCQVVLYCTDHPGKSCFCIDQPGVKEFCAKCNKYVCGRKGCVTECHPILESVDLALSVPGLPWMHRNSDGSLIETPQMRQLRESRRIF